MQGIPKTTKQEKFSPCSHHLEQPKKTTGPPDQTTPDQTGSNINDMWGMFTVNSVDDQPNSCIIVELLINEIPVNMTRDTGASVTIISAAT